ncbi:hypothetical protein [Granulicella sibirica]|uniref:Lipoprotein n=1 Tax=Granulicella sibirica TaxID=2479048 RepID=A0A4Q0SUI8_9BACT|nr:hypothetical protein [Granulicella sibirica]RXH54387.1 hypothetical protein GRAN_4683 [Granulicella sibirica]
MTPNRFRTPLLASLAVLATVACDHKSAPTNANYLKGLNAYFVDRSECLLPNARFPLETTDPAEQKRMNTLVASQLLKVSSEPAIKESRYVPTDLGAKSAPHFCYGHREVTTIDSATTPAVANGFNETQITYHYVIKDAPVWAKSADVQAAFPDLAEKMSGSANDKATLAQTRVGWQVPD